MNSTAAAGQGAVVALDIGRNAQRRATYPIARIHLLGSMRATTYLGDNVLPRGKKARATLAYLCLAFGKAVPRARLASMLWDRVSAEQARASFRHALSELCSAMGPFAAQLISTGRATVRLNTDACWIDALALLESSSPDSVRSDLALLCAGDLLEDLDGASASFDRWLLRERTRFTEKLRGLLESEAVRAFSANTDDAGVIHAPARPLLRTDTDAHQPLPGRNRLRVAVLAFEGNGSAREKNLAFSLSHEIAAALARFRWFDVITPISSMPLVNFTSDDLLQRKQLDYAVDGVIIRNGRYFQISVRLLDLTRCTQPVWSDRFELAAGELHRLNEMVTARVVGSIDPVILFIEGQPKRRERYGATGLLLLAIPLLHSMERKKFERAGEFIHRALEIDPQNAMALAWAALWHITRVGQGWAQDIVRTLATAESLCLKAIQIDPDNAEALGIYAHTCAWRKDFDAAVHYFDRSLRLNPNLAFIWALSAPTYCYIGEPDAALKLLERYRDLAPFDPYSCFFETAYVIAYTFKGDYERAVLVGRRAVKANPDFSAGYKPLIVALGHLGRSDEAAPHIAKLLSLEPNFTVERFAQTYPFKQQSDRERYSEGLRLAGIPER